MSYSLFRQLVNLTEKFEEGFSERDRNISNFALWLNSTVSPGIPVDLNWEGKEKGRSRDSVINTSLVHLYRYAKFYSKIAISDSPFSTIDDVIFLINLKHFGPMSKKGLIELNIHEKSTGIQIINRLLNSGFINEEVNTSDKRSKNIFITQEGEIALESNMAKIRQASTTVAGNLNESEKDQLIRLLQKLELFHKEKLDSGIY